MKRTIYLCGLLLLQGILYAMKIEGLTLDQYCELQKKYNGTDDSNHKHLCLYDTLSDKELYEIFNSVNPETIKAIRRKSKIDINIIIPHHHFDPSTFGKFANLTTLFLKKYNISDISFLTDSLCNLTHVWLDDNNIKNIEPLAHLPKITTLSLSGNNITVIESLKKIIPQLKLLDISDNPLLLEEIEELYEHYDKCKYASEKILYTLRDVLFKTVERDYYIVTIQKTNLKKKMKNLEKIKKKFLESEKEELILQDWNEYD